MLLNKIYNKKVALSISIYIVLVVIQFISLDLTKALLALTIFGSCILCFMKMKYFDNKFHIKESVFGFFSAWVLLFIICSLIYSERYSFFDLLVYNIPYIVIGLFFSSLFDKNKNETDANLSYFSFVSIGFTLSFAIGLEDWLSIYIVYWMGLETIIYSTYALFGLKIKWLDSLYEFYK